MILYLTLGVICVKRFPNSSRVNLDTAYVRWLLCDLMIVNDMVLVPDLISR